MIDVHCHFDLAEDPIKYISENEKNKLITIGMTNLPSHFNMGMMHVRKYRYIRLALGLHPLRAEEHAIEYSLFKKHIDDTSYIGEVGLDFSKEGIKTKDIQIKSFEFILDTINGKNKILSLHSRGAEEYLFDMLSTTSNNAIFHWYSGGISTLKRITESKYYFSVNSAMCKSNNGKKIISVIPKELILTETDYPFINNSSIIYVTKYLSELWGVSELEVKQIIKNNFNNLISRIL